jgi:putative pyruvate formate lyase activating enzyme
VDPTGPRPAYLALIENGEFDRRAERARAALAACVLCGRRCAVDRTAGVEGAACGTGVDVVVAACHPHFGEEKVLTGWNGSGTIFFARCNLRCVYCQNWEISHLGQGSAVDAAGLAAMMLELQSRGCHNVNLVSPSHVVAQILAALALAARQGLAIPLVWNSGGYDSPEGLELLDGVVDIYMPDLKYADSDAGRRYSRVRNYRVVSCAAVREMHRQVGDLVIDARGLAQRGLLVRHLVLPGGIAGTGRVLRFLHDEISPDTYVNLMDQYMPCHHAGDHPPLDRPLDAAEYERALRLAERHGIHRLDPRNRPLSRLRLVRNAVHRA